MPPSPSPSPSAPHRRALHRRALVAAAALLLATLPALTLGLTSARADGADLVVNGSFEQPALPFYSISETASVPGWSAVGGCPIEVQNGTVTSAYDGAQLVELNSECATTMQQVVPVTAGALYALSYVVSPRPGYVSHARVAVDGVGVADLTLDGSSSGTGWTRQTAQVRATGATMTLTFQGLDQGSLGMLLDDVHLTAVPVRTTPRPSRRTPRGRTRRSCRRRRPPPAPSARPVRPAGTASP